MPKRPATDSGGQHPEPKHRRRASTSKQGKPADGSSEKSGAVKRAGASHKTKGAGRTLTRSARQGGLLETLILGDQPEETVRRLWSDAEDALLRQAIKRIGARQWKTIAKAVPGRSHIQCMQRWQKVLEPTLNKGFWSAEEDDKLRAAVAIHGSTSWTHVAAMIHGRNCKQCRERWNNYLDPTLKKGNWEEQEDESLLQGRAMFGDRWSLLAKLLPGRSQIQVRDRSKTLDLKAKEQGKESAVPPPPTGAAADALVAASKAACGRRGRAKASLGALAPAAPASASSSSTSASAADPRLKTTAMKTSAPESSPHRALALALVHASSSQAGGEEASSERPVSPLSDTGSSDSTSSLPPSSSASSDGSPSPDAHLSPNPAATEGELVAAGLCVSKRLSLEADQDGVGDSDSNRDNGAGSPHDMQPDDGKLDTSAAPAATQDETPTTAPAHRHSTRFAKRAASQMPPPPPRTAAFSHAHSKPPRARRGRSRAGGAGMPCASSHASPLQLLKLHAQGRGEGAGSNDSGGSGGVGGVRAARGGILDASSIAASAAALIVGDATGNLQRMRAPLRGVDKSNRILHNLVRIARSGISAGGAKATTSQLSQAVAVASASAQRAAIRKAGSDALGVSRLSPSPPPEIAFGRGTGQPVRVGADSPSCSSSPSLQFEGSPGNVGMDGPSVCSAGGLDGDLTMDSIAAFSPSLARPDASPVTGALSGGFAHQCAADTPGSSGNRKWDPFRQPLWESPANFAAAFDISTPITSDYRLTEADVAIAPVSAAGGRTSRPPSTDSELMQLDSLDNAFPAAGTA